MITCAKDKVSFKKDDDDDDDDDYTRDHHHRRDVMLCYLFYAIETMLEVDLE